MAMAPADLGTGRISERVNGLRRRDRRRSNAAWVILWALSAAVPLVWRSSPQLTKYEDLLFTLLAVLGLNMVFGYAGEVSLGQPVIAGAAAYMAGVISVTYGWSAFITLPLALAAGVAMSIALNAVSFRLRGWYLAATTFFAVTVFPDLIDVFATWTQGDNGLGNIKPIPGVNLSFTGNSVRQYELLLAVTLIVFLGVLNLLSSRWGLILQGLRDCHNGVTACGGNPVGVRFALTIVSALPVALSGWMTAHATGFLVSSQFGLNQLLLFAGAVIIGGRGTLWGPVVGTVIFEGISLYIGPFSVVNQLVLGIAVLVISATFPVGVVGSAGRVLNWARGRWGSRTAPVHREDPGLSDPAKARLAPPPKDLELPSPLASTAAEGTEVFEVRQVSRSFGGLRALDRVDLVLRAGRITGLVGPNGSGKTTLLNVVTGFVAPDSGHIYLKGEEVTGLSAYRIARLGVRRSFQTPQLVNNLSLYDNLVLGLSASENQHLVSSLLRGPAYRRRGRDIDTLVVPILRLLGFNADQAATPVDELSLGLRRIAEIGRALVSAPQVLCLDEPAAGLGDEELESLEEVLRRIAGFGIALLLIEHNLEFVGRVSDTIVAMDLGRIEAVTELREAAEAAGAAWSAQGFTKAAASHGRTGEVVENRPVPALAGPPTLQVAGLSAWYGEARAVIDASLVVAPGEIVGVLGANGAGKSTLLNSIIRTHRKVQGSIRFEDHELVGRNAHAASMLGLGLVREGALVFPDMTVVEHLKLSRSLAEKRGKEWRGEDAVFEWLPILGDRRNVKAGVLSGGQRQLLAVASAAMAGPSCLLLDEPSAGLSESALETVFEYVRRIAADGITLLIAEQSERWLAGLADRCYWLEVGHVSEKRPDLVPEG